MPLTLIPLVGPFHLRYPLYNAVSVRDALRAFAPDALALTPLAQGALTTPQWQDTPEVALPHTVVPWARQVGLALYPVYEPSPDPAAPGDFRRYAQQYERVRQPLQRADALLRPLQDKLESALTLPRILDEAAALLAEQQRFSETQFGDGPATDWLRARTEVMAERILALSERRVAVLCSLDHLPFLQEALSHADLELPPTPEPSDESRERSLLDFAFRVDVPNPAELLTKLRATPSAEARYHEANVLLANDHLAEALETLRRASSGDFSEPYYLPGYLLARLGQLHDLTGDRRAALRSYRGVLALSYAPAEAVQAATEGVEHPFEGLHDSS